MRKISKQIKPIRGNQFIINTSKLSFFNTTLFLWPVVLDDKGQDDPEEADSQPDVGIAMFSVEPLLTDIEEGQDNDQ